MNHKYDISSQISIIIPAFNEQNGIAETLSGLIKEFPAAEIIVVNDGSNDETENAILKFEQVICLNHDFNRGYGSALKTGMRYANRNFIAWFDADNEHKPGELKSMLKKLSSSKNVAIIASRNTPSVSNLRGYGKFAIRIVARVLGVKLGRDVNCGLRVFKSSIIKPYLDLLPSGFSASVTSTMILVERGYPFEFYSVKLNPRIGESKVTVSDGFTTLTLVLRMVTLFAPLRIFFRGGVVLIIGGIIYGLILALNLGRGVPPAAVLTTLSGVLLCILGLIADQISQMRLNQLIDSSVTVRKTDHFIERK